MPQAPQTTWTQSQRPQVGRPAAGPAALGPVVVGRGDRRPFLGESEAAPLARLARYVAPGEPTEGGDWSDPLLGMAGVSDQAAGAFNPVEPGSLSGVPRLYVFVHGWVPGGRSTAEEVIVADGEFPLAWDERVSNALGRTLVDAYEPLLAALAQRDPQAAVLWYSWVDQSGTGTDLFAARDSLTFAGVNGRRLAAALASVTTGSAGSPAGMPPLHLIGHSHGSVVATYAALSVARPPAHLTLLDCPEDWFSRAGGAAGLLCDLLPRLQPGRGAGATFVDAYASMFGRAYHDDPGLSEVVDVRLAPVVRKSDQASAVSQAHHYPVDWYAATVADPDAAGGFAWSPLHGCDTTTLGSGYLGTARGRVTEVVRHRDRPVRHALPEHLPLVQEPVELTSRQPDAAYLATLPGDALFVEFDLALSRPGPGTRVDIAVDGGLACSAYACAPLPARARFVRVVPGRTTVQFRLVDPGPVSSARITALRVVTGPRAPRNLDDSAAMARVAALGAAAGVLATIAVAGFGSAAWTLGRRLRGGA